MLLMDIYIPCYMCDGTGKIQETESWKYCESCAATGRHRRIFSMNIDSEMIPSITKALARYEIMEVVDKYEKIAKELSK